jgi:hypothetical protein
VSESRALHKETGAEAIAMRNAREIKACPRSLDGQGDRKGSHSKGPGDESAARDGVPGPVGRRLKS